METFLIRQLQDPAHEHHAECARKTRQVVRLPTAQLVGALNEHVSRLVCVCPAVGLHHQRIPPRPPRRPALLTRTHCMQLAERRQGNAAYRARNFQQALHHYERALSIVEFVQARRGGRRGQQQQQQQARRLERMRC